MALAVPDIPRRQHPNHFNYTEDELAEKEVALKEMARLWPEVSTYYAEMVYDMCKNKSPEELEEIKKSVIEKPSKYKAEGGEYFGCSVLTPEESEEINKKEMEKTKKLIKNF